MTKENILGVKIIIGLLGVTGVLGVLSAFGAPITYELQGYELEGIDATALTIVGIIQPLISLALCFRLMGVRQPRAMRTIVIAKVAGWLITVMVSSVLLGATAAVNILFMGWGSAAMWAIIAGVYALMSKSYQKFYT